MGECGCGDPDCMQFDAGYPLCSACQDHHRPWPQCPGVDQDGNDAEGWIGRDDDG